MDLAIPSLSQRYLSALNETQARLQKAQLQVSSGRRLQQVADDPLALGAIYQDQAQIATTQQTETNLSNASTDLSAADTALQNAVSSVQDALALAARGASTIVTTADRLHLAAQVVSIQQNLVALSQTSSNGRYIFSGDLETQPPYKLDPTQPNGVSQLITAPSTKVVLDASGVSIAVSKTAQEIFDLKDAAGNPTTGNVFAAVQALLTGLQNDDSVAITQATDALKAAGSHLNDELEFYGNTQTRVTDANTLAQKFVTQEQGNLGQLQDADIAEAAIALTQAQTQQQATLAAEAKVQQTPNLFSYLG